MIAAENSFRHAVEARDIHALVATLDDEVSFSSPVAPKPYRGKGDVAQLLSLLFEVFEDFRYVDEFVGPAEHGVLAGSPATRTEALVFHTNVAGKRVQGIDLLTFGDWNLVVDLTVLVRPLPAAMTLARTMGPRVEALNLSR